MIAADLTEQLDRVEMHMRSHCPCGMAELPDAEAAVRIARKAIACLRYIEALQKRAQYDAQRRLTIERYPS